MEKGIIVEAYSQGNVTDLINKVIDAANKKVGAEDIPNIFAAYADTAYAVDQLGLVASLDPYLTKEELAEYRPEFLEEGRFDKEGNLKIFPTAKSVELLMLNRTDWDPFASATGAQISDLKTMEGITATAKKYYEWTDQLNGDAAGGKALFGRDAMANYFIIGCRQLGVEIFAGAKQNGVINLDKKVLRKLWDHYYVPFISGYFGGFGRFRSDDAKTGDLISFVGSSTGATYFPESVAVSDTESYPIDCTILPAPYFQDGEKYAVQQGAGMVVAKADEKEEYASTLFLKWFTEADRNIEFAVCSGYLPVKKEALNLEKINRSVDSQSTLDAKERMKQMFGVALEQIAESTLYTSKAFEGGTQARNLLENSMTEKAKADRASVVSLIDGGEPHADAVARYTTDQNFETWFEQLSSQFQEIGNVIKINS